jgi:hypothetical protein
MLEEALGVLCRDRGRSAWWVASKSASGVLVIVLLKSAFVLEKVCSVGLKPGEYGGRSTSVQPRHSIASFTHTPCAQRGCPSPARAGGSGTGTPRRRARRIRCSAAPRMIGSETLTSVAPPTAGSGAPRVAVSFPSGCVQRARHSSSLARMRRLRPVENLGDRSSPSGAR